MAITPNIVRALAVCIALSPYLPACGKSAKSNDATENASTPQKADVHPSGPLVTCPVCGLEFHQSEGAATATYKGRTYYFFLADHQKAFKLSPEKYLEKEKGANEKK